MVDILIIPFRPSQPNLDTFKKMQEIIIQAKAIEQTKLTMFEMSKDC